MSIAKLTSRSTGAPVFVNSDHVVCFKPSDAGGTLVYTTYEAVAGQTDFPRVIGVEQDAETVDRRLMSVPDAGALSVGDIDKL